MTYASDLIECAHCGSPITGERKTKMTKSGERDYVYYRCTQYHKGDHPRIRLTENELDAQMLAIFDTLRVEDDEFRDLFREQLRQATNWESAVIGSKRTATYRTTLPKFVHQQDQSAQPSAARRDRRRYLRREEHVNCVIEEAELQLEIERCRPWPERNHRHCGESV